MTLKRWDGKIVVSWDFAGLLTMRPDDKIAIFGLLRQVYDGTIVSDFGSTQAHLEQRTRFDWIAGTTDYIDESRALETSLGSRFIDLRWRGPETSELREKMAEQAIANDPYMDSKREAFARQLQRMVDSVTEFPVPSVGEIAKIADFTTRYRTPVKRDKYTREIMSKPHIEGTPRVSQMLNRIATGLNALGVSDIQPYLVRLALDTLPPSRAKLFQGLIAGIKGRNELAEYCGISLRALDYLREELYMLDFRDDTDLSFLAPTKNRKPEPIEDTAAETNTVKEYEDRVSKAKITPLIKVAGKEG